MKHLRLLFHLTLCAGVILCVLTACSQKATTEVSTPQVPSPSIHRLEMEDISGTMVSLGDYKGQVLLIANTASKCGFTPQYADLEAVHNLFHSKGFSVIGFPSNNFGAQEPGSNKEIVKFCKLRFGVTFPLFSKSDVKGENINPVFKVLTQQSAQEHQGPVKWNFEKFLLDKEGRLRYRFGSFSNPQSTAITDKIKELLAE